MKNQARHFGRLRRAEMCTAYIFILPMFAGLLLFSIIPFIQNILYSFRKMGTFGEGTFIGLKNYQDLLKDDTFWLALQNTVFYAVVGVPLVIIFSIFLAHQINKKIRGRTIYRTLLFIPANYHPGSDRYLVAVDSQLSVRHLQLDLGEAGLFPDLLAG